MESLRAKSMRPRGVGASSWLGLLPAACCLLPVLLMTGGCNNGKQLHRDLIARELRLQEDEIYRLEDYLEEYQRKVCCLRAENRELQEQLGEALASPSSESPTKAERRPGLLDLPDDAGPSAPSDSTEEEDPTAPDILVIDFGTPIDRPPAPVVDRNPPSAGPPESDEAPPFQPGAADGASVPTIPEEISPEEIGAPAPAFQPLSFEADPTEFTPIAQATALPPRPVIDSVAITSRPGPPEPKGQRTLVVRITPKLASGDPAPFAGEASLMLRDPLAVGERASVARWDYSPAEVASLAEPDAESLEFLVGLPGGKFRDLTLELWVRLVDEQGNKTLGVVPVRLPKTAPRTAIPPSPPPAVIRQASWSAPLDVPLTTSLPPAPGTLVDEAPSAGSTIRFRIGAETPLPTEHEKSRGARAPRPFESDSWIEP